MLSSPKLTILSLGWGVQSWGAAAMSALGVLPSIDYALHSDTAYERVETYDFAAEWTPWLEANGVPVITVSGGRPLMGTADDSYTSVPAFTRYAEDVYERTGGLVYRTDDVQFVSDGGRVKAHSAGDKSGMLRRQCTHDWKILPMRRWVRGKMKERGIKLQPGVVEQWLGITLDEVQRMKHSDAKFTVNRYPFIEMLDRPWTRGMVVNWLLEQGLGVPVKSSCYFCPYHDKGSWREIKAGPDWPKAVSADEAIRNMRPGYLCYLAAARIPLTEVDFRNQEDHGQLSLWDDECSGVCFL